MKMTGSERIVIAPNEMAATVKLKVGIVAATLKGEVRLENVDAPNGYTIVGEGKGGVAGFAEGGADVVLEEDGATTTLNDSSRAQVDGKLAQMGARLIDSTARRLAGQSSRNSMPSSASRSAA